MFEFLAWHFLLCFSSIHPLGKLELCIFVIEICTSYSSETRKHEMNHSFLFCFLRTPKPFHYNNHFRTSFYVVFMWFVLLYLSRCFVWVDRLSLYQSIEQIFLHNSKFCICVKTLIEPHYKQAFFNSRKIMRKGTEKEVTEVSEFIIFQSSELVNN